MRFSISLLGAVAAAVGSLVAAAPAAMHDKRSFAVKNGVNYTLFEHAATGAKMEFVTNSGICETTEGVNQYSGYLSVGTDKNMWFWFFEARTSPSTAPLAMWLNGGPGCSSMIGLFHENGPCHFIYGASAPSLNPYSFNTYANMLYVDQPIGTGFSYGVETVTSTVAAAPYVWNLLQAFYAQFPTYENHDFGLFTESYGGHYGPEFSSYFASQNAAIAEGTVTGTTIPFVALGINNGWYDAIIQYKALITYAARNSYNTIISASKAKSYNKIYTDECLPALKKCRSTTGFDFACETAGDTCTYDIENPIVSEKDYNIYDVREPNKDPYILDAYVSYLQSSAVMSAIGAHSAFKECAVSVFDEFSMTGDKSRSFIATMSSVVSSGIRVLMWAGDADMICNYVGNFNVANSLSWASSTTFAAKALKSYTVNGVAGGLFKTVSNLSWLQVYEAGHEVPRNQPALALQAFKQTLSNNPLSST